MSYMGNENSHWRAYLTAQIHFPSCKQILLYPVGHMAVLKNNRKNNDHDFLFMDCLSKFYYKQGSNINSRLTINHLQDCRFKFISSWPHEYRG